MSFIPTGGSHFSLPKPMQKRWRSTQYQRIGRFSRKATGTFKQVARKAKGGIKEAAGQTTGVLQSVVNFFTGKGKTQKRRRRR
jgi:hypothetical protein